MRIPVLIATAATILFVASCAATDTSAGAGPELPPRSAPASNVVGNASPQTNERGNLVKQLGEKAGLGNHEQAFAVTFTLDKVEVDPPCAQYGQKRHAGHMLLLHFRVATGNDPEVARSVASALNPFNFNEITTDGLTKQAQAGSCTAFDNKLPYNYGINQQYSGTIEIVVPEASGIIALNPPLHPDAESGGWEWHY